MALLQKLSDLLKSAQGVVAGAASKASDYLKAPASPGVSLTKLSDLVTPGGVVKTIAQTAAPAVASAATKAAQTVKSVVAPTKPVQTFEVGAGLTPEQKAEAQRAITRPLVIEPGPTKANVAAYEAAQARSEPLDQRPFFEKMTPQTTQMIQEAETPVQKVTAAVKLFPSLAKELMVQEPARVIASLGLSAGGATEKTEAQPKTFAERQLLGEEAVRPMGSQVNDLVTVVDEWSKEQLKKRGQDPNSFLGITSRLTATGLSGFGMGILEAANFDFGLGEAGNKALGKIIKQKEAELGRKLLKNEVEDLISGFAEREGYTKLAEEAKQAKLAPEVPMGEMPKKPLAEQVTEKVAEAKKGAEIKRGAKAYRNEFLNTTDAGQKLVQDAEKAQAAADTRVPYDTRITDAIQNTPAYKKDQRVQDWMGEALIMEKDGKEVLVKNSEMGAYRNRGYTFVDEVDNVMPDVIGTEKRWETKSNYEVLSEQMDARKAEPKLKREAKISAETRAHEYLIENDPAYREMVTTGKEAPKPTQLERLAAQKIEESKSLKGKLASQKQSITNALRNTFESKLETLARADELKLLKERIVSREAKGAAVATEKAKAGMKLVETKRDAELRLLKEKIVGREQERVKKEVAQYINDALPVEERGKYINMLKNAKNQGDVIAAFVRVNVHADELLRKNTVDAIKQTLDAILESGSVDVGYKKIAKELVEAINLKAPTNNTRAALEGLRKFIARERAAGRAVALPEGMMEKLSIIDKTNITDLSQGNLDALLRELQMTQQLGKLKLKSRTAVYEAKKALRTNKILGTKSTPISTSSLLKREIGQKGGIGFKVKNFFKNAFNKAKKVDVAIKPIDELAEQTGMTALKETYDLDYHNYLLDNDKVFNPYNALVDRLELDAGNFERVGVYAISQQRDGMEKLANLGISPEQVAAIRLTPQEREYYEYVRSEFERVYEPTRKFAQDVYNVDVGKIDNYVPYQTDYSILDETPVETRFGNAAEQYVATHTKKTEMGFVKKRVGAGEQKAKINLDKIFRKHMSNVNYMVNLGEDIKMYSEIVNSGVLNEQLGDIGTLAWKEYNDLMARNGGVENAQRIAWLDAYRRNLNAAYLSASPVSAIVQLSSFADGAGTIGAQYMTEGAYRIATDKEWRSFILENFPEIRQAIGDDPAFTDFDESFMRKLAEKGMKPLVALDGVVRSSTAAGAYAKACIERGIPIDLINPDRAIIQEVQKTVRRAQGSPFFKDQPLGITKGFITGRVSIDKALTQFQSFGMSRFSNLRRTVWEEGIKAGEYSKAAGGLFWLIGVTTALEEGIRRGYKAAERAAITSISGEPDDTEKETDWKKVVAMRLASNVPIVSNVVNALAYDSNPVPTIEAASSLITSGAGIAKAITSETATAESQMKAIARIGWQSAGMFVGTPGTRVMENLTTKLIDAFPVSEKGKKTKATRGISASQTNILNELRRLRDNSESLEPIRQRIKEHNTKVEDAIYAAYKSGLLKGKSPEELMKLVNYYKVSDNEALNILTGKTE